MHKRAAVLAVTAVIGLTLIGLVVLEGRKRDDVVDLRQLVASHVDAMPARQSGDYPPPTPAHRRAVAEAWDDVVAGRLAAAEERIAPFGYEIDTGRDPSIGPVVVVRGPGGLFVHAPEGDDSIVVEVPHPRADRSTETFGLDLFRQGKAGTLLVAGAHRTAGIGDAADVARRDGSAFQAVHVAAVTSGSTVVQVHGYASTSAPAFDVIVSSGAEPTPQVTAVERGLAEKFQTCVWSEDATGDCRNLGGTRNVQGAATRAAGASFIHLELSPPLRLDPDTRRSAVAVVAKALAQG